MKKILLSIIVALATTTAALAQTNISFTLISSQAPEGTTVRLDYPNPFLNIIIDSASLKITKKTTDELTEGLSFESTISFTTTQSGARDDFLGHLNFIIKTTANDSTKFAPALSYNGQTLSFYLLHGKPLVPEYITDLTYNPSSSATAAINPGKIYSSITTEISYTRNQASDWIWISSPYDCTYTLTDATGKTLTSPVDFQFNYYDSEARARNGAKKVSQGGEEVFKLHTGNLTRGTGYILGINTDASVSDIVFPVKLRLRTLDNAPYCYITGVMRHDIDATTTDCDPAYANWRLIGTGIMNSAEAATILADKAKITFGINKGGNIYETVEYDGEQKLKNKLKPYGAFFTQYAGEYTFAKDENHLATMPQAATQAAVAYAAEDEVPTHYFDFSLTNADTTSRQLTHLRLGNGYTDSYEQNYDFLYLNADATSDQLYTLYTDRDGNLAPMQYNYTTQKSRSLALAGTTATTGTYSIDVAAYFYNLAGDKTILDQGNSTLNAITLTDTVTSTTHNLWQSPYTFTATAGENLASRFTVKIQYAGTDIETGDCITPAQPLTIAGTAGAYYLYGATAGSTIDIFDTTGRLVASATATSDAHLLPSLHAGIYLIRCQGNHMKVSIQ